MERIVYGIEFRCKTYVRKLSFNLYDDSNRNMLHSTLINIFGGLIFSLILCCYLNLFLSLVFPLFML